MSDEDTTRDRTPAGIAFMEAIRGLRHRRAQALTRTAPSSSTPTSPTSGPRSRRPSPRAVLSFSAPRTAGGSCSRRPARPRLDAVARVGHAGRANRGVNRRSPARLVLVVRVPRRRLADAIRHTRVLAVIRGSGTLELQSNAPLVAEVEHVGHLRAGLQLELAEADLGAAGTLGRLDLGSCIPSRRRPRSGCPARMRRGGRRATRTPPGSLSWRSTRDWSPRTSIVARTPSTFSSVAPKVIAEAGMPTPYRQARTSICFDHLAAIQARLFEALGPSASSRLGDSPTRRVSRLRRDICRSHTCRRCTS